MNRWSLILFFYWFQAVQLQAQVVVKPPVPFTLFVGAQAFQSHYAVFFPVSPNNTGVGMWQLVVGGNLSRRLAIQGGYTYVHDLHIDNPSYTGTNTLGQQVSGSSYNERRTSCVPFLVRYSALRFPSPRLQVDLIAGATLLQTEYILEMEDRVNNQVVESIYDQDKVRQLYATLGLGLRYPFGRHVEGVFDWTYSRNFRTNPSSVNLSVTGNGFGLTRALSLGLRYRFNVGKKIPAVTGS